jgi:nucleotidyltransferase substrate binding protein (TIGR01987 family)
MIDFGNLEKSLRHLDLQLANLSASADRSELSDLDREAIAESVIQRFETAYDTLWKTLKRYLSENLGLPDLPNSPKPIFRLAAQNRTLSSPVDVWLAYADARTATAHDYSGTKAQQTLKIAKSFALDARDLLEKISA